MTTARLAAPLSYYPTQEQLPTGCPCHATISMLLPSVVLGTADPLLTTSIKYNKGLLTHFGLIFCMWIPAARSDRRLGLSTYCRKLAAAFPRNGRTSHWISNSRPNAPCGVHSMVARGRRHCKYVEPEDWKIRARRGRLESEPALSHTNSQVPEPLQRRWIPRIRSGRALDLCRKIAHNTSQEGSGVPSLSSRATTALRSQTIQP